MVLMKLLAFGLLYGVYVWSQKPAEASQLEDQTSSTNGFDKTATPAPGTEEPGEQEV